MAEEKVTVFWRPKAQVALQSTYDFIADNSVKNANEFIDRMLDFGDSLATFPNKYAVCRFLRFARYNLRCASFERNYIFVYKLVKNELLIYTIAHTKRLK